MLIGMITIASHVAIIALLIVAVKVNRELNVMIGYFKSYFH